MILSGVYLAKNNNGSTYYRSSITYQNKHISLGSYKTELQAHKAYLFAGEIINSDASKWNIGNYPLDCVLSFEKWVVLINSRDNKIYFKNPIYLKQRYFLYYIDQSTILKFDVDDLFFYAKHKIMKRGGYLFVSDFGMQVNILSRYGIKNFAVSGKDYIFSNGDPTDYRYGNIEVINRYHGVQQVFLKGRKIFITKIHINGDYIVGRYHTELEAAIAYNKAALILRNNGTTKNFPENYIDDIDEITYASIYQKLRISKKILSYKSVDSE